MPPIALTRPPFAVSHGSQALTDTIAPHNATSHPGRTRDMPRAYPAGSHRPGL
ncbi:uncharacterized protein RMCN_5921 [Mycolicibacterium novocastrense]|uniref:Uncharacterized protein n=1 Tax=Mycolicibacterium novocastrense TaxID=59813 RepID=A0ABQ0KWF7_MYCNV|nr:uncharacterized protein RMCN_5921 [Mycolicibacterium novocastrense]